ncbi:MAG: hypothetical protein HY038_01075 [Nitrospirae bacterium]|nr:hypothetical protein [Nitrospirota bacterium]
MVRTTRGDAAGRELLWQPANKSAIRKTIPPRLITRGQFMVALLEEPGVDETVRDSLIIILLHRLQNHLTVLSATG